KRMTSNDSFSFCSEKRSPEQDPELKMSKKSPSSLLRSTLLRSLASCFLLLFDIIIVTKFFRRETIYYA
ncbi:MAG: hypothetical protein AB1765_12780, partial [Candidatus Hydrogenedentota bacterium]